METRFELLDIKEALALYQEKTGRDITDNGLFYLAKRHNFLTKAGDGFHCQYIKEKMLVYINQIMEPLPDGYLTIGQLANKYGKTYSGVYWLVNEHDLKPFYYGIKKVLAYNEEDFKRVL